MMSRRLRLGLAAAALWAVPMLATAQDAGTGTGAGLPDAQTSQDAPATQDAPVPEGSAADPDGVINRVTDHTAQSSVAVLKGLDRISGQLQELQVKVGTSVMFGDLDVAVGDCRYPVDNPAGDAFAFLTIQNRDSGKQEFRGWMIASAPALNPLDDMRYDVWVERCKTS